MAFDETLAKRIRAKLGKRKGVAEKQMFGGLAFLLNGNMCVGVHGQEMIVRLSPDETQSALAEKHTRVFDLTGRPMKSWILVAPQGFESEPALAKWIGRAVKFVETLPKK